LKTRICKECGQEKPETEEFFQRGSNQSGKKWWLAKCRECMYPNQKFKTCPNCKKKKPIEDYYNAPNNHWCKDCFKKYQNERKKKKINQPPKKVNQPPKKVNQPAKKIKESKKLDEVSINGLNGDLKAIELYKDLSQKIFVLMRKNRIEKYGVNAQNIILDLMNACYKHLQKEIKEGVIPIDWE